MSKISFRHYPPPDPNAAQTQRQRHEIEHLVNVLICAARDGRYATDESSRLYRELKRVLSSFQPANAMTLEQWEDYKTVLDDMRQFPDPFDKLATALEKLEYELWIHIQSLP